MENLHMRVSLTNISRIAVPSGIAVFAMAFSVDAQCPLPFPAPQYDVGAPPRSVAVGDLTGDGAPEIITTNDNKTEIAVLINSGDGNMLAPVYYTVGTNPYNVALGDLDGDLDTDIVVAVRNDQKIAVLLNDGSGVFTAGSDLLLGTDVYALTCGDVDGDGNDDVIAVQRGARKVGVYHSDGLGGLLQAQLWTFSYSPTSAALGDIDGDGDLDMAVVDGDPFDPLNAGGTAFIFPNPGGPAATWAGFGMSVGAPTSPFPEHVRFAQLDGLGGPDLIVCGRQLTTSVGTVDVLLNSSGAFPTKQTYIVGAASMWSPWAIWTATRRLTSWSFPISIRTLSPSCRTMVPGDSGCRSRLMRRGITYSSVSKSVILIWTAISIPLLVGSPGGG